MSTSRGLVPPAILTTAVVLILCSVAWGALGVISIAEPDAMSTALHRFVTILLATATTCSVVIHVTARLVRAIRVSDDGYAAGYADGLDARPEASAPVSPAVRQLVRPRR